MENQQNQEIKGCLVLIHPDDQDFDLRLEQMLKATVRVPSKGGKK